jgi:hypothetical protein
LTFAEGYPSTPLQGDLRSKWLELNYYHPSASGFKSEIINADYFLTPQGKFSPDAEYLAFLDTMWVYSQSGKGEEVLCKYPARMTLVSKYTPWVKRPKCKEYLTRSNPEQIHSISLVFASGYFESPASYFGHTMLKFDSDKDSQNQYIFESGLTYGAKVTDATGSPFYVIHGLTGGYTGSYQKNNDFLNTYSYTNNQMRDVWEYKLNLSPAQKTFIIEHAWELQRAKFNYYFFTDNCASRVARLVEMATGRSLTNVHGKWLFPIQIVQNFNEAGKPKLVQNEIRHESLKSKVRTHYLALSGKDKEAFAKFLTSSSTKQQKLLPMLDDETLALILNQLDVEGAELTVHPPAPDKVEKFQRQRRLVLAEMFKRPPASLPNVPSTTFLAPTPATMHRPSAIQVGYTVRPDNDALLLRYQVGNNDLYTSPFEGQEASRFLIGAVEAEATSHTINLHKVTLLDIASFNTNPLPMKITKEYSWAIRAEYGARNEICTKCSAITAEAKIGKASRLNDHLMIYSLIGPQVNHRQTAYNDYLMLTAENGALIDLDQSNKLGVGVDIDVSMGHGNPSYLFKSTFVHKLASQRDLRFTIENDGKDSAGTVRLGFYFN